MHLKVLAAVAALFASQSAAQQQSPPKLLVVISIDQFSANLFDEYRPHFTQGMARIASGTAFRNGFQSHALATLRIVGEQLAKMDATQLLIVRLQRFPGRARRKRSDTRAHLYDPFIGYRRRIVAPLR